MKQTYHNQEKIYETMKCVLIALGSILAIPGIAAPGAPDITNTPGSNGVRGCTGKLIIEPAFIKGDIE